MAITNVKKAAEHILSESDSSDIYSFIDALAYNNSLLIFLTDTAGSTIYSTDEHSALYNKNTFHHSSDNLKNNPYYNDGELMNWQIGALRNLPYGYDSFLKKLSESKSGTVSYKTENGSSYIYGALLPESWSVSNNVGSGEAVLYISSALEAVGGTVGILRMQLIWTTIISLVIGIIIAYFASRRFSAPVASISAQAKGLADGNFSCEFQKGFCSELDELADTLSHAAEELKKTDEFRREFLANISHDLRTPLTMIKGYAEAVRDFSWEDEKEREEDLGVIIREADRLTGLVNDILEYSALRSGNGIIKCENTEISALTQKVISNFSRLCKNNGCIIQSAIEPEQTVYGNKEQMERVLYNLIDNAITHSGENKKIEVVLKHINNHVRIEVHDFGKGISKEELPYIWDRYFTLKQQKRNEKGSGLGLAISKEILLAHKADFGVESEMGQGSIFWFELKSV
ncbi:MAG: ATP-binding protein [Candidatus Ornithomonoglobus sp.]